MTSAGESLEYPACLPKGKLVRPYNDWVAPELPASPTLAVCGTAAEVAYFAGASDLALDALIAVTPQAACECRSRGIPYHSLEAFFDVRGFWEGDEPMLELQRKWVGDVDAFAWRAFPEFRESEFDPAVLYFFFLKVVVDMLFRSIFGLSHLLLAAEGGQLYYCRDSRDPSEPPPHWGKHTLFFDEPIHGSVLPLAAAAYGVRLVACASQGERAEGRSSTTGEPVLRRVLARLPPSLRGALRSVRKGPMAYLSRPQSRGATEIIFGGTYDVDRRDLERSGFKVVSPDELLRGTSAAVDDDFQERIAEAWMRLSAEPFFRAPFVWCGVDLYAAAESRLEYWCGSIVPSMWQMADEARRILRVRRCGAALFFSQWSIADFAVSNAARSLGIPVVTFQHGGFEGSCEYTTYDMTDLRQSDYRFVYGEGVARYFRERTQTRAGERLAKLIPVGSARLDALSRQPDQRADVRARLGVEPTQPLILYIPTGCQFNSWYMARQSYVSTPYFEFLTGLLETSEAFDDLAFVYKPFPEVPPNPFVSVLAARDANWRVSDIPVPQLLQASDAVVIDIPSTALLEALMTTKPILVYADARYIALRPEARELLRRRVTLAETLSELSSSLDTFLRRGRVDVVDSADREFLRAYGTHHDDGRSGERTVDALRSIAQEATMNHERASV